MHKIFLKEKISQVFLSIIGTRKVDLFSNKIKPMQVLCMSDRKSGFLFKEAGRKRETEARIMQMRQGSLRMSYPTLSFLSFQTILSATSNSLLSPNMPQPSF